MTRLLALVLVVLAFTARADGWKGTVGTGATGPAGLQLVGTFTSFDNSTTATSSVAVTASTGDLIVVMQAFGSDAGDGAQAVTGVSSTTLGAFTLIQSQGGYSNTTAYYKVATAPITTENVTFTRAASGSGARAMGAWVFRQYNASPIGTVEGWTDATPANATITSQSAGSYILFGMGCDGSAPTFTANAASQIDRQGVLGTLQAATVGRTLNVTPNTTPFAVGATNTSLLFEGLWVEIKAQ